MDEKKQRLQNLISFSLSIRESFHNSMQRISEQKTEHLSLVASISAAVLAITAAFSSEKSVWINMSFWSLFITVLVGTILVLLIIHIREEKTSSERELAISVLDNLKDSTRNAIGKGPEYDIQHREDFEREVERIKNFPDKYQEAKTWLNFLYWLALGSFALGMLCLAAYWLDKGGIIVNMNLFTLMIILVVSMGLGFIKFGTLKQPKSDNWNWQQKFAEFWNCSVNFLIAGLVAYYFVVVRWSYVVKGDNLIVTDFVLLLIFGMGMFGHLNVLSFNLTKGIEAILKRVLERK